MKQLLYVPFCLLLLLCNTIFSQNSEWMRYNNGDYIADIEEEGELLWICTWGGLVKYDRNSCKKTFYNKLNSGLPNNQTACIGIDSKGNKWLGYDRWWWRGTTGLVKFDGTNWEEYNTANSELPSNKVNSIVVDHTDNIWIGTSGGLVKISDTNWVVFNSSNSNLPVNEISCLVLDGLNNIWIGTSGGLVKFDGDSWEVYKSSNSGLPVNEINCIEVDLEDNIWIGIGWDEHSLVKFDGINWEKYNPIIYDGESVPVYCIEIDENNNKWIGTQAGLAKFDNTDWTVYDYQNSNLQGWWISSLMATDDGLLWVGECSYEGFGNRSGNGLYTFDGATWDRISTSNCGLIDNSIRIIKIDNNNNKWIVPNWKSNKLIKYDGTEWTVYDSTNSILGSKWYGIRSIEIDMFDNLWIAENNNLIKYDGINWAIYDSTNSVLGKGDIQEIAIDSSNNIWIVFGWNEQSSAKFDGTDWSYLDLPFDKVERISVDIDGSIWIGSYYEGKIAKLNENNWITDLDYPGSEVDFLEIDNFGNKWIGSFSRGLYKFNGTNWTYYNRSNSGLPDNYVTCIAFDEIGNKWIGSLEGGLAKFDDSDWTVYNTSNSLLSSDYIQCIDIDKYGNKWFGGYYSGLTVFNEDGVVSIKDENKLPNSLPSDYLLHQNHPNPFNPTTTIKYSIPKQSNVTLKVFDVLGSEVATLVQKIQPQGNYEVEFDGIDLTSGIYFYRLTAGDYVETKKMILLK